ncbi:hypothetical protein QL285_019421 [Trifolium repens]|nr:hypothetical protein QL285_019421 [Trifolium repens]
MTKTGPNMKENLQKQEKASRQSPRSKRQEKTQKNEENQHFIASRWLPSCHDGSCLFAKKSEAINLKKIFASQHDGVYRSTMESLGAQADEMHRISYKNKLNLHIALR